MDMVKRREDGTIYARKGPYWVGVEHRNGLRFRARIGMVRNRGRLSATVWAGSPEDALDAAKQWISTKG